LVFFGDFGWAGVHELFDEPVRRWLLLLTLVRDFSFAWKMSIASGSSSGAPLFFQRRTVERVTPQSDAYSDVEDWYFVTPEAGCQSAHEGRARGILKKPHSKIPASPGPDTRLIFK
jgi:hypothetical protein